MDFETFKISYLNLLKDNLMEFNLNYIIDKIFKILLVFTFFNLNLLANDLDYSLIKKGRLNNNTVLVIGGIQGDEPGGFLAASILATDYNITHGSVWVVPNLNFISIIKRDRGIYGDMNRKFDKISINDPDFKYVNGIKKLITDENVSMIINLHDGSGFYRYNYINNLENPKRWGNSCIIDQVNLKNSVYGNLESIAKKTTQKINNNILDKKHIYHVKNTHTAEINGDKEMLKSLTYFAIKHHKSAFANEASKSLPSHERAYYHLLAIEEYLNTAGIKFNRDFDMTPQGVKNAIEKRIDVHLFGNKFYLILDKPRNQINYVPMPKDIPFNYTSTNPLIAIIKNNNGSYSIHYGNRILTKLKPVNFSYSNITDSAFVVVDGEEKKVLFGSKIDAKNDIKITKRDNIRVNFIGYGSKPNDESNILIDKKNLKKAFSIDKKGNIFRVEFYESKKNTPDKFIGMFLVELKS